MAEKRFKPTPRRLQEARKRGDVAVGHDLPAALVFVAVLACAALFGAAVLALVRDLWLQATGPAAFAAPGEAWLPTLAGSAAVLLWTAAPLAAVTLVAAVAGGIAQVGGLMAWVRIKPDVKRLDPLEGAKRIFSRHNLLQLTKMLVKTLLLGALIALVVRSELDTALALGYAAPSKVMLVGGRLLLVVLGWAALIYVAMALVDTALVRIEFVRRHRMSIDDLRREYRDVEGDPTHLARRRVARFEALYAGVADQVRAASVLLCAGHQAIALQYEGERDLPRVVARGANDAAARMRRAAAEAGVPIEFDAVLVGRLFDDVPEGQPIPRALFAPVAAVLRRVRGRAAASAADLN